MATTILSYFSGIDTAFGYTTLIDPKKKLKQFVKETLQYKLEDPRLGMNQAELCSLDMLINGQHFSHTGVYGLFDYSFEEKGEESFPIHIKGQKDSTKPCYQMTEDMDLVFTFHPVNNEKVSNCNYAATSFIWKYELQHITDDSSTEVTVHGYFKLESKTKTKEGTEHEKKTQLDLSSKYDKKNLKWIRFTSFEPGSPQQRAWFIPIRGMAFGKPRNLFPRYRDSSG